MKNPDMVIVTVLTVLALLILLNLALFLTTGAAISAFAGGFALGVFVALAAMAFMKS